MLSVLGEEILNPIYQKVGTMGARDAEEFKSFVRMEIQDKKVRLAAKSSESSKVAAVAKQQAATGIQRGGSPVATPKKEYGSFDDMKSDMGAMLDNLLAVNR